MSALIDSATLAADVLDCSTEKVYRMARAGEIPHIKVGREYRFDPEAVKQKLSGKPRSWAQPKRSLARRRAQ